MQKSINQQTLLVRIRPQAYTLAKQLARQKDVPMSVLISDLVKERWYQYRAEDQPPFQDQIANLT